MEINYNTPEKELESCSRDELIGIIKQLRAENATSLAGREDSHNQEQEGASMPGFREKYTLKILESLPNVMTVISDSGMVQEWISSERTSRAGMSVDHVPVEKDLKEILPEDSYALLMEDIKLVNETHQSTTSVHSIKIKRKMHYFENRLSPLEDGYKLSECRDVTEAMVNKKALETVSYAINNANENIFALKSDGTFIFANKQFLKEHNLEEIEPEKLVYEVLYTIRNQQEWEEIKQTIRANNGVHNYSSDVLRPDGTGVSYELVVHSARYENDIEIYWFFARDVTDRRRQEIRIHELNSLMDAILNNIPVYLFVKDTADNFRYLYWNKAFEEHSGIPASKALGNTDFDIFPSNIDADRFRRDDQELLRDGQRVELLEEYAAVGNRKRIVKTIKVLVPRENDMPLLIGVSWDITDIKHTEQLLIEAKLAAEESSRLKTAFLANMSHEIRTPLNAIVGFSRLISSADSLEEKQQFSDIIDSNADLLLQLINDILDLSKIEAGTLEFIKVQMDFTELCNTMYEVHKMKVKEGVSLFFDGEHSSTLIVSDRNRLAQVLTNLLTNAIKFTPAGEIHFGYSVNEGCIEAYVKDSGIGIVKDKLNAVFERFVKLNMFAQGTGLGLSITKMIVEKLGGTIQVASVVGQGTEFRFTIPLNCDEV